MGARTPKFTDLMPHEEFHGVGVAAELAGEE